MISLYHARLRRPVTVLTLTAAVLLAGHALVAQEPEDSVPTDVLRVDTRLVQVDVVVRDDDGAVGDLTIDDFTVFDDGEPRKITLFEVTTTPGEATDVRTEAGGTVPATTSNRPASTGSPISATIVLLDRLNTETVDQPYANSQALEFLESLDGRHQVAIYELGAELRLIQDYTNDRDLLIRAATGLDTRVSGQLDASFGAGATGGFEANRNEVGLDQDLVDAQSAGTGIAERGTADLDQQVAAYFINNRIRLTADVLYAIAGHMARIPGRKNLIWLSGRFPFSFDPTSEFLSSEVSAPTLDQLERTARAITDANVAVYPVSAVGLLAPEFNQPTAPAGRSRRGRTAFDFGAGSGDRFEQTPDSTNTMQSIARMTGGQAFYLTNGIAAAMTRAVDDTAIVYTIGFSPSSEEQDSGFHTLRVEVDRDDVTVRHRRGYYGFGSPELRTTDSEVPIEDLVRSPINATSIGIVAIRERLPEGGTSTRMAVSLDDLDLEFVDDRWKGQLEVATLLVEPGDSASGIDVGELTIDLTDEQFLLTFDIGGYPLFRLRNDGAFLRIVVREPSSGAAGSMWVELR